MFIGFVWYSKAFFGTPWLKEIILTEKQVEQAKKEGMTKQLVLGTLSELVMAYAFGLLVMLSRLSPFLVAAIACWFAIPIFLGNVLWQRKSWNFFAISLGHRIAELFLFASIFHLI